MFSVKFSTARARVKYWLDAISSEVTARLLTNLFADANRDANRDAYIYGEAFIRLTSQGPQRVDPRSVSH